MNQPAPALKQLGPHCDGCGTSVRAGVQYCDVCAKKPFNVAPKASFDLGKHPTPPYDKPRAAVRETDE